jgi:hypothetical protein
VHTGVDATPASHTAGDIETVAELDPVHRRRVGDRHLPPVALAELSLQSVENLGLALRAELHEAGAQQPLDEA